MRGRLNRPSQNGIALQARLRKLWTCRDDENLAGQATPSGSAEYSGLVAHRVRLPLVCSGGRVEGRSGFRPPVLIAKSYRRTLPHEMLSITGHVEHVLTPEIKLQIASIHGTIPERPVFIVHTPAPSPYSLAVPNQTQNQFERILASACMALCSHPASPWAAFW